MSLHLELAALGCVLNDPDCADAFLAAVRPTDVADPRCRRLHTAIATIREQGGQPDPVAVHAHLAGQGVADPEDLDVLVSAMDAVPTSTGLETYAGQLREISVRRELLRAVSGVQADQESPPRALLERLTAGLLDLAAESTSSGPRHAKELSSEAWDELEEMTRRQDGIIGVRSGFAGLDWKLSGLRPGRLHLIAARPGHGKSTIGLNIAVNVALAGHPVLYASLEMSRGELLHRAWSGIASRPVHGGYRSGDRDALMNAAAKLSQAPLWIDDCPEGLSIAELRARIRAHRRSHGTAILVVDYLQLMSGTKEIRREEVEEISRGLKRISRSEEIPVIALAQLSRAGKDRASKEPVLSDLRESGALEQDADVVFFLHPVDDNEELDVWPMKGILAKNRGGPTGMIPLSFVRSVTRMYPVTREEWDRAAA